MKELAQIIAALHQINQQVIDRDNLINAYDQVFDLFEALLNDEQFKESEIYLDLRMKYLSKMEAEIAKIKSSNVNIQPANVPQTDTKKFSSGDVNGPIQTNIFMAPRNRRKLVKKKEEKKTTKKTSKIKNVNVEVEDEDEEPQKQYVEFEHDSVSYYIDTEPEMLKNGNCSYNIYKYDESSQLKLAGSLMESTVTILNELALDESMTISLESDSTNLGSSTEVFPQYVLV